MRQANKTTLIFLGTCLGFAETTLGILANTTNANPTLVAAFAVIALGMVLTALILMYWREPAFLTFSGDQALDLRKLEAVLERMPPELLSTYVEDVASEDLETGKVRRVYIVDDTLLDEVGEFDQEIIEEGS